MRLDIINEYFLCTYILQLKKKVQQAKAAQGMETTRLGDLVLQERETGLAEPNSVELSPGMPDFRAPVNARKKKQARDAQTDQTDEVSVDRDAGSNVVGAQRRLFETRLDRLLQMDPNPSQAEKTNFGLWLGAVSANMPDHQFQEFQQRAQDLCNHFATSRWTARQQINTNPTFNIPSSSGTGQFQQPAQVMRQMSDPTGPAAFNTTPQQGPSQYASQYSGEPQYHNMQNSSLPLSNTSLNSMPSFSSIEGTGMGTYLGLISPNSLVTGGLSASIPGNGGGGPSFSQSQS